MLCKCLQISGLQIQQWNETSRLKVSEVLPHVGMKVGKKGEVEIPMILDSGAGVNVVELTYFRSFVALHPEAIESFKPMNEASDQERLAIGGINAEAAGVVITHVITFYTPYEVKGEGSVQLVMGCAENVATTAIISYTFLQRAAAEIKFGKESHLRIPMFDESFALTAEKPRCKSAPTSRITANLSCLHFAGDQVTQWNKTSRLKVSDVLPHINMKLGKDGNVHLPMVLDSGSSLNLGERKFFMQVVEVLQEIVAWLKTMREASEKERLAISGINADDPEIVITHVIGLKLPNTVGGESVELVLGLADNVATTALLGYTFLQQVEAEIKFGKDSYMFVPMLNESFAITAEMPRCRSPPMESGPTNTKRILMASDIQQNRNPPSIGKSKQHENDAILSDQAMDLMRMIMAEDTTADKRKQFSQDLRSMLAEPKEKKKKVVALHQ